MSFDRVTISRVGLTASLGWTASQACAAARAGVTRTSEVGFVVEDDEGDEAAVLGHAVRTIADGFSGAGRLARICGKALDDLNGGLAPRRESTGFFLHVSDHYFNRAQDAFEGRDVEVEAEQVPETEWAGQLGFVQAIREHLLPVAAKHASIDPAKAVVYQGGAAGFVNTFESAALAVVRGECDRAIVGAVDSLVTVSTLRAMAEFDVLKTPLTPTGAMPGECAAFLLIEAAGRAGPGGVQLGGVARRRSASHRFSADPPTGAELRQCVQESFERFAAGPVGVCIASLNGDERRAREYAGMVLGLQATRRSTDFDLWCPAASFGETGAATAALSICLAARAFERNYAHGKSILTVVVSDDADRASFFVTRAAAGE